MPFACAPSFLFPEEPCGPMSTESRSTFVWNQPGTAASSRSYRGNAPVSNPLSMSQQTIHSELQGLGARLAALDAASKAAAPAAESAAPPAPISGVPREPSPWDGRYYDSFAKFAGEASRVKDAGRLPFGSDSKKMAL